MKAGIDYIGVGCGCLIINDKNEVLLVKRAQKCETNQGIWTRPGGSIKFGETVEAALKREIREELGVDIEIIRFSDYSDDMRYENGIKKHYIALGFIARIKAGEIKNLDPENEEIKWFHLDKMPENLAVYTRKAVDVLLNIEPKGI